MELSSEYTQGKPGEAIDNIPCPPYHSREVGLARILHAKDFSFDIFWALNLILSKSEELTHARKDVSVEPLVSGSGCLKTARLTVIPARIFKDVEFCVQSHGYQNSRNSQAYCLCHDTP